MHTPYDHLTDTEFVALLRRNASSSPEIESCVKRLTENRYDALDAARNDGYDEGYAERSEEALSSLPARCPDCGYKL